MLVSTDILLTRDIRSIVKDNNDINDIPGGYAKVPFRAVYSRRPRHSFLNVHFFGHYAGIFSK